MPKRAVSGELHSPSSSPLSSPPGSPRKRKKRSVKTGGNDEIADSTADRDSVNHDNAAGKQVLRGQVPSSRPCVFIRDQDFYFADGSVTLCVDDVLFKIQASLLQTRSSVFEDMFSMPLGESNGPSEGACDENPIVVPGVKAAQFRNLMRMFYCPPSDKFFVDLQAPDKENEKVWDRSQFYLDVARLSDRFGIPDMEEWATSRLKKLVRTTAGCIAVRSDNGACSYLLDALEYFKAVSNTSMARSVRSITQCYWFLALIDGRTLDCLVEPFRTPGLAQRDPAAFGYIFTLLLGHDCKTWEGVLFTREDRMALFSAAVHLIPLPPTFQKGLRTPLLVKPTSSSGFLEKLWTGPKLGKCDDECRVDTFRRWQDEFSDDYYTRVSSSSRDAIAALVTLPVFRMGLAKNIRKKCPQSCYTAVIRRLDEDLDSLYTKVAGYYREIK